MLDLDRYSETFTEQDLDSLLRAGEGQQIEFKERLSSILELARNVSSLANAHGGVIVIGARESKPQIVFGGNDPRVSQFFDNLGKQLRPLPDLAMHRVDYRGVPVPVIVVKPHP